MKNFFKQSIYLIWIIFIGMVLRVNSLHADVPPPPPIETPATIPISPVSSKSSSVKNKDTSSSRYEIHNNGTVTDTKTGLMWKQCAELYRGNDCSSYDTLTQFTWGVAAAKFTKFSKYAGYNDWRMPTIEELKTLVDCHDNSEEIVNEGGCNSHNNESTINSEAFPNTPFDSFWSLSISDLDTKSIYTIDFSNGQTIEEDGTLRVMSVRLVRGKSLNKKVLVETQKLIRGIKNGKYSEQDEKAIKEYQKVLILL